MRMENITILRTEILWHVKDCLFIGCFLVFSFFSIRLRFFRPILSTECATVCSVFCSANILTIQHIQSKVFAIEFGKRKSLFKLKESMHQEKGTGHKSSSKVSVRGAI